jgi:DNA-directed RNA polymerase specialized sigma24 family protein
VDVQMPLSLKFDEIAARMGRSAGAARMLWARALEKLSRVLEGRSADMRAT